MVALRTICGNCWTEDRDRPREVGYRFYEDQNYASILLEDEAFDEAPPGHVLWLSWYKRRGRTEAAWLLNPYGEPRRPTEEECLDIISAFIGRVEFGSEVVTVLSDRRRRSDEAARQAPG